MIQMMTEDFLAGYFAGTACFTESKNTQWHGRDYRRFSVSINTSRADTPILKALSAVLGCGTIARYPSMERRQGTLSEIRWAVHSHRELFAHIVPFCDRHWEGLRSERATAYRRWRRRLVTYMDRPRRHRLGRPRRK